MSQKINPTQLNLQSLAASSGSFEGRLDRATDGAELDEQFARLASEACVPGGLEQVVWRGEAELREGGNADPQVWLHLAVSASLPMICQRCMTPTMVQVMSQQWFRFVTDEATAVAEDDLSEEDVLVLAARFNVLALVEDELLMSLPLVPMHERCPDSVPALEQPEAVKPNPFAVLAGLKNKAP
jgi:uncharacterized protein